MPYRGLFLIILGGFLSAALPAAAGDVTAAGDSPSARSETIAAGDIVSGISAAEKRALARDYIRRIGGGFAQADKMMADAHMAPPAKAATNTLPDGEILMFRVRLPKRLSLDIPVLGQTRGGDIVLSLRDFIAALELPITLDADGMRAAGWYLRQDHEFSLDLGARSVRSKAGSFTIPGDIAVEDGDLFVPFAVLAQWFGFTMRPDIGAQDLFLETPIPLPLEDRIARRAREFHKKGMTPPVLPRADDDLRAIDFPFIDVATRSEYLRPGSGDTADFRNTLSVRTAGDFAYGTLSTQVQATGEDGVRGVRVNYKRESPEPELLGPLGARRFEIGDVNTVRQSIGRGGQEQGLRITNIHPLRRTIRPSTEIAGTGFPGWDVELYRDNQLIAFQEIGDDGTYLFDNISLFMAENNFRIVQYGPQGEVQEETRSIPVDASRLSGSGGVYDISLTRAQTQTYNHAPSSDIDRGSARLSAIYEHPVGDAATVNAGIETTGRGGEQRTTLHAGVSTVAAGTLLNLDTAREDTGEMAASLVARRSLGSHELRNEITWSSDNFDLEDDQTGRTVFSETLQLTGPVPLAIGSRPRYNLGIDYNRDSGGDASTDLVAGFNTAWQALSLGQQFNYSISDNDEDALFYTTTTVNGVIGRNRLRLASEYGLSPDSGLRSVTAGIQRYLNNSLETGLDLTHTTQPKLTTANAYLNWDAGFARISPQIGYNSDNDVSVTLSTRFGLLRDPQRDRIRMFDRSVTSHGGISAFVFLDRDGNNIFDGDDEPLSGIVVQTPQNGGRMVTGDDGYALLNRLGAMRLTDVYVDPESLPDPLWVSAFAGLSVLPREGHVRQVTFPIHQAGEIDGTVYLERNGAPLRPLRGVTLRLIPVDGGKEIRVTSEPDGFYLFSRIPPGRYYLDVDDATLRARSLARPAPVPFVIGYEGTTVYGHKVIVRESDRTIGFAVATGDGGITQDKIRLTLGTYKSQLGMGLSWFAIKARHAGLLRDLSPLTPPSRSNPDAQTGLLTLRVELPDGDLAGAWARCDALVIHDIPCGVEIPAPNTPTPDQEPS